MSKQRRTVTLDPEVDEYLSQTGTNASELVNELVKTHASAGGSENAMLKLREQQVESELRDLESRAERKRQELEYIREQLAERQTKREDVLHEARNTLEGVPLEEDNPAVQHWAEKADMTPSDFLDALTDGST